MSLSMARHLVPSESVTFDAPTQDTLIVGLGNPLRGDDGVGIRVVELLAARELPVGVEVVDGGTQGLELVNLIEGWQRVILVDAANLGLAQGQFRRFSLDETRLLDVHEPMSIHAAGLRDALLLAQALGVLPGEVIIYGVQPAKLDWETELSPQVEAAIPEITNCILDELEQTSLPVGDFSSEPQTRA